MSSRERKQAEALEYARSQGWVHPGANSFGGISASAQASEKCVQLEARVAELEERACAAEAALDTEEKLHTDTRNAGLSESIDLKKRIADLEKALERRGPHLKKRIAALEDAIRAISDAEKSEPSSSRGGVEVALMAARTVLG